jgi:hypothetical protein
MSPLYSEGDLGDTKGSFSPSVRKMCCSQVGRDVLRQEAAIRRYAPRVIRTMRAQKVPRFPGMACDVLAPLHIWLATPTVCRRHLLKPWLWLSGSGLTSATPPRLRAIEHEGFHGLNGISAPGHDASHVSCTVRQFGMAERWKCTICQFAPRFAMINVTRPSELTGVPSRTPVTVSKPVITTTVSDTSRTA